jgi:glycosyltransferase involved in cell wall biosynthesis
MWSFTGRCAFSFECEKYLTGCDETCPTPHEYPCLPSNEISKAWQDRVKFFQKSSRLAAVTPSAWLAEKARGGLWQGLRVERIPYSLPLEVYAPVEKTVARQALGLDMHSPVLLIAGVHLGERRKGVGIAIEAIKKTRHRPLTLLTLGSDPPPINLPDVWVQHLGFIDHERTKALVYNAADLFIHPALADNLPNTVIESIVCGTPVIAFDVGGLPELVHPGKTGWLAPEIGVESFTKTIDIALEEIAAGIGLRDSCCQFAKTEFSSELQAQRYLELIRQIG